jgi:hypothetical protein
MMRWNGGPLCFCVRLVPLGTISSAGRFLFKSHRNNKGGLPCVTASQQYLPLPLPDRPLRPTILSGIQSPVPHSHSAKRAFLTTEIGHETQQVLLRRHSSRYPDNDCCIRSGRPTIGNRKGNEYWSRKFLPCGEGSLPSLLDPVRRPTLPMGRLLRRLRLRWTIL